MWQTIGQLTGGLVIVCGLAAGLFVDDLRGVARMLVSGWEGINQEASQIEAEREGTVYIDSSGETFTREE